MNARVKTALGIGAALAAAAALTSCSKSGSGGAAQAFNEAPSSTAYTITPGQYETTIRVTNGSLEGFPAEAQEQLRRAQANPMTQRSCIPIGFSLESASLRNLRFTLPNNMGGCNIGEVNQDGGNLRGNLSCDIRNIPGGGANNAPQAVSLAANWNGTYTADSTSTMTFHAEGNEPGGSRRGSIDVEISTRRVGDCPAGSSPFGPSMAPPPSTNSMNDMNSSTTNSMGDMSGNMSGGKPGADGEDTTEPTGNVAK